MQSVLPKRALDDVSGELFLGAYVRKFADLTQEQVSHIADKAIETCRWFPTIAECLELLAGFQRNDQQAKDWALAKQLSEQERRRRRRDDARQMIRQRLEQRDPTLRLNDWEISRLPADIIAPGLANGMLVRQGEIVVDYRDAADYEPPKFVVPERKPRKVPDCLRCHDLGRILDLTGEEIACPECGSAA